MCLLITIIAAVTSTGIWYAHSDNDLYKVKTLAIIYWGAALMWMIDFVFEFAELKAEYFNQPLPDVFNDAVLGIAAVTLGAVAWLVILLIRDPKHMFRKKQ
ncbi:MAG: hypothetical protein K6G90_01195 [Clostridia bacterium]|nr:hypothetical protein [Clostridia bacterium]